jgi:probable F420-dependent oxidoreductase
MKFGIRPFYGGTEVARPEYVAAFARMAEEAGCDSIWTAEHVVVPDDYRSSYPYRADGRMALTGADAIPDPLDWLAFVAGITTSVRLATGMLILPEHNPVILAKRLATVDALSGGRVLAGVGVGWLREEADAVGVPFEERGARTDEYIAAMRALWRERPASFDGKFVRFSGVWSSPPPAQPGGVPIVIGGHSPAAIRRAARLGDGFYPIGVGPEELAAVLARMRRQAEEAGRDPAAIEVTAGGTMKLDVARRYEDLGVSRLLISPRDASPESARAALDKFHDAVMSRL